MIKGWTTWDNRYVPIEEITHQHLSNIYYYTSHVLQSQYPLSLKMEILKILMQKFGSILPYRPDVRFVQEREYLQELGYLRENGDIVIQGKIIGKYEE